jgi:uncharacterized membrane protein
MTDDAETGPAPQVRAVAAGAALRWLRLGWTDLRRAGAPSLLHGLIVTLSGVVIVEVALHFWPLLPGALSGFLVVGPILAAGLYALSRRLEQGQVPRLRDAVNAWRRGTPCLFRLGLLLALVATGWVAISAVLLHFFVEARIASAMDFLRYVLDQGEGLFLLWSVLAGLVTAVVFSLTVVSVPMLVDRDVTTPLALSTSVRAVGDNPVAMFWWALFILGATALSIATLMLGFLVLYPLMGHASWHAYRDVVDASALPSRDLAQ